MFKNTHVTPHILVLHQDIRFNVRHLENALKSYNSRNDDSHNFTSILTNFLYRFSDKEGYNYLPFFKFKNNTIDTSSSIIILETIADHVNNHIKNEFSLVLEPSTYDKNYTKLKTFFLDRKIYNLAIVKSPENRFDNSSIPDAFKNAGVRIALK